MNELEKSILDIFEKRYKRKYVGGLKVLKLGLNPEGYKLILYLGNEDKGIIQISADLNADDFLKYIEQEIISRLLIRTKWFRGIQDEKGKTYCEN